MTITIPDSARLRYRLMDERDKELWFEMDQDPEAMRFLGDGQVTSRERLENLVVPRFASFTNPALGHGLWEFTDRQSGEFLGWILVRNYRFDHPEREHDNVELGWRVKRQYWGKGLATEGASAVMAVLQQDPSIRVFSALAAPANIASTSVMKKLGMRYMGERVHVVGENRYPGAYYEMPSPNFNGRLPA